MTFEIDMTSSQKTSLFFDHRKNRALISKLAPDKKDLITGLKGYEKLLTKTLPLVAPNGFLLIASCSYHAKEADLKICLIRALQKTKREGRIVQTLSAGLFDHPTHPMLEKSSYLKGFLVFVM